MSERTVPVQLSARELVLLTNAINEAREAIDDWEFHARVGARPEEARALERKLKEVVASLEVPK